MSIKDWSENERPREKLLHQGVNALSDAELLAILLRTGTSGMDAVAMARHLLKSFGSLRQLLSADLDTIKQHKGLGVAAYTQFAAVRELGKRLLKEELQQNPQVSDSESFGEYLRLSIGIESVEVMLAIFLNQQNQIIKIEELSRGTVSEHTVYIREVLKKALQYNASSIIIAHNHPSGSTFASEEDRIFTIRLKAALKLIEIQLLDHFIVTANESISFAQHNLL